MMPVLLAAHWFKKIKHNALHVEVDNVGHDDFIS
jgi:hypothetical protein